MSYFLGNSAQYSYMDVDHAKIERAQVQFDVTAEQFNRLLTQCRNKCVRREYGEGDLNTGEASCVDRCVSKYVQTNTAVAQQMQHVLRPTEMPEYKKVALMMSNES